MGPATHAAPRPAKRRRFAAPLAAALALAAAPDAARAQAQGDNPVYVDDSPSADEALTRATELARVGNFDEAARVVQGVLDDSARALVPDPALPAVFITARTRAHRVLTAHPELLEHYRDLTAPDAASLLQAGQTDLVERTMLLTPAGYEAALRIAQQRFEDGAFWSAWRVIAQLDNHPDHDAERAAHAARLLAQLAPFLLADPHANGADQQVLRTLDAWGAGPVEPIQWPDAIRTRDPLHQGPALSVDSLLDRPLASDTLGPPPLPGDDPLRPDPAAPQTLATWPTILGPMVLINNGATITAWNRYSLAELWRITVESPEVNFRRLGSIDVGEPSTVATDGDVALAITGVGPEAGSGAERVAVALDARTGALLWTRMASDLDGPLADLEFAGRPLLAEGVAVVPATLSDPRRRLVGEYLLAFDAYDGRFLWVQPLGSMGASGRGDYPRSQPILNAGVVYFTYAIGVCGAVEARTGRILWVRTEPAEVQNQPIKPWEIAAPIVADARLITLSPDRQRILEIDPATGRPILVRSVAALLGPRYLVHVADRIAIVTESDIYAVTLDDLAGPLFRVARPPAQLLGRVVTQGQRLLVPASDGGWLIDPVPDGFDNATRFELEHAGNIIATADQMIAVDDHQVHSYLLWEEAERILVALMQEDPADPSPAITYAELAFRSGRLDPVLESFDHALQAIAGAPQGAAREAARSRLYEVLREIVDPSVPRLTGASPELLDALTERLGRVALTPPERVGYLLAAGWQASLTDRPAQALAHYQSVLESPELRSALYQGRSAGLAPAELEATQRLRALVIEHDPALYRPYADKAAEALAAIADPTSLEPLEEVARAYPLAPAAVDAWVRASDLYAQRQRPQRAILAARQGVETARGVIDPADPALGRAVGRLIERLMDQRRYRAARDALARAAEQAPSLRIEVQGQVVELAGLADRLDDLRAQTARRPRIGHDVTNAFALEGWIASPPLEHPPTTPNDRTIVRSVDGDVAMALVGGEPGLLWERKQLHAEVIALDEHAVYLGVNTQANFPGKPVRQVMALNADTGAHLWTTPPFYGPDMFQEPPPGVAPRPLIPLRGAVPPDELTALVDETTIVLLDRIGNAAGFDLATGDKLWAERIAIDQVFDSWLAAGMLAVGGRAATIDLADDQLPFEIAIFEARTGQAIVRHREPREVTWLRISPDGDCLAGLATDIIKLDPFRGEVSWRSLDPATIGSLNGWTIADRLVFRDGGNNLFAIDIPTGANLTPITPPDVLDPGFSRLRIRALADGAFAIATAHGVAVINREGDVIGRDAPTARAELLPAAFAESHAVTLEAIGQPADNAHAAYRLAIYELPSLRAVAERSVQLPVAPDQVSLLDGRIVISAAPITLVLEAPPTPDHQPR